MSNDPRNRPEPGKIPAAFSANGQDPPSPAPEPEQILASYIGEAVGQHLGAALQGLATQPACVLCVAARKKAELDWQAAMAEAGQPLPPPEMPQVAPSVTWIPLGQAGQQATLPVCYPHFSLGPDVRPVGLVDPSGQPLFSRSAA